MLWVSSSVVQPSRAAASAASVPAWPPPTTMTSNSAGSCMGWRILRDRSTWNYGRNLGSTWNNCSCCIAAIDDFAATLRSRSSPRRRSDATFAISLLGRLPIGLTGLAILLLVQTSSGSFAQGGAAAACYVIGLAAVAPLLGRAIDRYGPRRILICTGVLFPAALIALVFAVDARSTAWTLVLAGGAGASFPPITVCVRTYFRRRLAEEGLLAAAYSAESVVIELIFIVGPMLVALFIAKASAATAVWFSATCGLAGTLLFLRSPALRSWHIEPRRSRSLLGPLTERGFPALVGVVLCFSSAFGFLEVGVVAYASEAAQPALAGVLLGVTSAGSALGGFAYGSRGWHYPLARQFVAALAVMAAGLGMLALGWQPWLFCALGRVGRNCDGARADHPVDARGEDLARGACD